MYVKYASCEYDQTEPKGSRVEAAWRRSAPGLYRPREGRLPGVLLPLVGVAGALWYGAFFLRNIAPPPMHDGIDDAVKLPAHFLAGPRSCPEPPRGPNCGSGGLAGYLEIKTMPFCRKCNTELFGFGNDGLCASCQADRDEERDHRRTLERAAYEQEMAAEEIRRDARKRSRREQENKEARKERELDARRMEVITTIIGWSRKIETSIQSTSNDLNAEIDLLSQLANFFVMPYPRWNFADKLAPHQVEFAYARASESDCSVHASRWEPTRPLYDNTGEDAAAIGTILSVQ